MAPTTVTALARASELGWADPVRAHYLGSQSALLASTARASLAASLTRVTGVNLAAEQVFLAPTMSVACTWAIAGFRGITRIAHSAIETLALLDACQEPGLPITSLPVDSLGHVTLGTASDLEGALLVIQGANIEIGTIQDLSGISAVGLPLLIDATALIGRESVPSGWSVLLAQATAWGGPAGVTVIAAHPESAWAPASLAPFGWVSDGSQVPAVVAAATALETLLPHINERKASSFDLVEHLRTRIASEIADVAFAGDPVQRVPHILNCSVLYVSGEALVSELDRRGFAVASGSACVADSDRASHVLVAIGAFTGGNLRISLPFDCTIDDVDALVDALAIVVHELRTEAGI